jgi:hypothetical protein
VDNKQGNSQKTIVKEKDDTICQQFTAGSHQITTFPLHCSPGVIPLLPGAKMLHVAEQLETLSYLLNVSLILGVDSGLILD